MPVSVRKNLLYQIIFQTIKILMPIITIPIVSNALGSKGIGISLFTGSIAEYFVLFSSLGISIYGNREIAMVRDNPQKLQRTFTELVILKLLTTGFSLIGYFIVVQMFFPENTFIYFLQSFHIIAVLFDISWFFMGLEDFKKVTMSHLFIQVLMFLSIVLFIRDYDDLYLYVFIIAGANTASQAIMWFFARKLVHFKTIRPASLLHHLKQLWVYFIPQIAITLYSTLNQTILGVISGEVEVGLYGNAVKISATIVTMISTINNVMLPRMSHLFANQQLHLIKSSLSEIVYGQLFISIPAAFGLSAVIPKLVPWFFGLDFLELNQLIPAYALVIIVVPLGMSISNLYLLPTGNTKIYTISVFLGAGISILLNLLLIPFLGAMGAILTTAFVESFVTAFRLIYLKRKTHFTLNLQLIGKYLLSAVVMALVIRVFTNHLEANMLTNLIQLAIGLATYAIMCALLKVTLIKRILQEVSQKLKAVRKRAAE